MSEDAPLTVLDQSIHFLTRPHSGIPDAPVEGAAAWRPSELPVVSALVHRFSNAERTALRAGAERAQAEGRPATAADFAALSDLIGAWRTTLLEGRGFVLARGIDVRALSLAQMHELMRGLGCSFGRLGMQNARGDVIGEVRNTGAAARDPFVRNYVTDREFRFHCDAADLLGLLCVRKAWRGGRSKIASSVTVFNELRGRRPDLARRLFEPVLLDFRNEQPEGAAGFSALTPCAYAEGRLRTIYISDYFRSVERHADVQLSRDDMALLDLYEDIAEENCIEFDLEPGDLLLLNNHVTLHARTAFEDAPGAERLLLRFLASVGA